MFLHTVLTGLQNDRIQSDQPFLSDPTISDEVLLERLNVACSHESERQSKRKSERSAAVHVTQLNEPVHEPKHQIKQTKFDLMSQLKSLSEEIMQIKETIQQPSPVPQCFAVNNKTPVMMTTIHQPLQDFSQSYQPVAEWRKELPNQTWETSHTTHEQRQYPLQTRHPKPQQNAVPQQQHTSQFRSLQPYSTSLQQPLQHPVSTQYVAQPSLYASPQCYPPQRPSNLHQQYRHHSTLSSFDSHVLYGQDSASIASKGDQRNYAVSTFQQAAEPEVQGSKIELL